jgi:hypothetical protein
MLEFGQLLSYVCAIKPSFGRPLYTETSQLACARNSAITVIHPRTLIFRTAAYGIVGELVC